MLFMEIFLYFTMLAVIGVILIIYAYWEVWFWYIKKVDKKRTEKFIKLVRNLK